MVGVAVVLRHASIRGVGRTEFLLRDGFIAEFGACSVSGGVEVIDVAGATVLPGLHDHHCHLLAMAAAGGSVRCGPPDVGTADELSAALHDERPIAGWVRGIGYHKSVASELDRHALDRARADVPVRVQHRGGSAWFVNSVALLALGLNVWTTGEPAGIERGVDGLPSERLWRCDDWLRDRLGRGPSLDLGAVSEHLASFGITGVADATPDLTSSKVAALRSPSRRQRLTLPRRSRIERSAQTCCERSRIAHVGRAGEVDHGHSSATGRGALRHRGGPGADRRSVAQRGSGAG